MVRFATLLFIATGVCLASDAFTPPLIGYVAGNVSEVRAIVGTPGAARVTRPLPLPEGVERIVLAPGKTFGIAFMADTESAVLLHSLDTQPAASVIPGAMKSFDRAQFSGSGKAVALFGRECECVQAITGMPDQPTLARQLSVTGRDIVALAVSDDASVIAYSSAGEVARYDGESFSTWNGTARALTLSADASTLAVVDADRRTVATVRAGEWTTIADEADPIAIAFIPGFLLVADASSGAWKIDLASGVRTLIECPCKPTAAEPTALQSAFRLTSLDSGVVWLLHVTEEGGQAVFVPLERDDAQEPGQ